MKFYTTLLLLCFSYYLSSQTLFGPTLSYDFATLETLRTFKEGTVVDGFWQDRLLIERSQKDNGSGRRSIAFGFQVQKLISKQWSLGLRGNYSKKQYIELVDNFWPSLYHPEYKIFYQQTGLSVLVNRKIKDRISIGIGPNISHFTKWSSPSFDFDPYQASRRAYGLDVQLGYYLGPIFLSIDYTKILKIVDQSGYMTGASNLAVSGTYFFELRKRK